MMSRPPRTPQCSCCRGPANSLGSRSDTTRDYLEKFWEALDEVLNAMLFVLREMELVVIGFNAFA
jgi:NhaP-type Na+/H+ or K+/H+ antiporter